MRKKDNNMFDMIGSIASSIINSATQGAANAQNQSNATAVKNQGFADNRVKNAMLSNFIKTGNTSLDQWNNPISNQDYNDVADYFNPYLSLNAVDMQNKNFQFMQDSYKENMDLQKDLAYNGAQIKAKDYEKAGFNKLLAVGNSANASPVSAGSSSFGAPHATTDQAPLPNITGNPTANIHGGDMLNYLNNKAQVRLLNAQADKIEAEAKTEGYRPENLQMDTKQKEAAIELAKTDNNYKLELINSELKKQKLTDAQIEKYNVDIEALKHDFDLSEQFGIKMNEMIPYAWQQLADIFQSMGIDESNPIYPYLTLASIAFITFSGGKINKTSNKGKNKGYDYAPKGTPVKDVPKNSYFTGKDGKTYFKNKDGKISEPIKVKEIK